MTLEDILEKYSDLLNKCNKRLNDNEKKAKEHFNNRRYVKADEYYGLVNDDNVRKAILQGIISDLKELKTEKENEKY